MEVLIKGIPIQIDEEDIWIIHLYTWCFNTQGYVCATINGEHVRLQRLLTKAPFGKVVDHINGVKTDYRKSNLRICSISQNSANVRKTKKDASSKYKGVSFVKSSNVWRAEICKNYNKTVIGMFNSEEEAAKAYDKKAIELFGEFARINFPLEEKVQ